MAAHRKKFLWGMWGALAAGYFAGISPGLWAPRPWTPLPMTALCPPPWQIAGLPDPGPSPSDAIEDAQWRSVAVSYGQQVWLACQPNSQYESVMESDFHAFSRYRVEMEGWPRRWLVAVLVPAACLFIGALWFSQNRQGA